MTVFLKYLDEKIEANFKKLAAEKYPGKKNAEKLFFTDLINFIDSKSGQKFYDKWMINQDFYFDEK